MLGPQMSSAAWDTQPGGLNSRHHVAQSGGWTSQPACCQASLSSWLGGSLLLTLSPLCPHAPGSLPVRTQPCWMRLHPHRGLIRLLACLHTRPRGGRGHRSAHRALLSLDRFQTPHWGRTATPVHVDSACGCLCSAGELSVVTGCPAKPEVCAVWSCTERAHRSRHWLSPVL